MNLTLDNRTNIINNLWGEDDPLSQSSRKPRPKLDFDFKGTNKSMKFSGGDKKTKTMLSKVLKKIMPLSATSKGNKTKKQSLNGSLNKTLSKPLVQNTPKSKEISFSRSFKQPNLSMTLDGRRISHRRDNSVTLPMTSLISPHMASSLVKKTKFSSLIRPPVSKNYFTSQEK